MMNATEERDGSISSRGWSNVKDIIPQIQAAVADRKQQYSPEKKPLSGEDEVDQVPIDLSTAENWLLRKEMLELCRQGVTERLNAHHLCYPSGLAGDLDLLSAMSEFFNSHFRPYRRVTPDQCVVAPGAAGCLDALIYNICDADDGILVPAPCWNAFDFILRARTTVKIIPVMADTLEACLGLSLLDALETSISSAGCKIRALLMVNPNNPLGRCYSRDVLEKCLAFCELHDLHFISDEIYALTSYHTPDLPNSDGFMSALSLDLQGLSCDPSRVHVVWSMSKDFGLNGLRLGCLVTQSNETIRTGAALFATTTVSSLTAVAAMHILRSSQTKTILRENSNRLGQAYAILTATLKKHAVEYFPADSGLYVLVRVAPEVQTWEEEAVIVSRLKHAGILVSAGKGYHTPSTFKGWARVGFALPPDKLAEAIKRLDMFFSGSI